MKLLNGILACVGTLGFSAGLAFGTTSQTRQADPNPGSEAQHSPIVSCRCVSKPPPQPGHPQTVRKPACDYSCDCERQKSACSLALAQEQAEREADLGKFYLDHGQYTAALTTCQGALKLAGNLQLARDCEGKAIRGLAEERRVTLSARLDIVDVRLWRAEADEAFAEIARIRTDLAPAGSPLGDFDEGMNADIAKRSSRAKWLKWLSRGIPLVLWTALRIIAVALALLLGLYLLRLAVNMILRHQKYRTIRLVSDTVDWTVWSIRDSQDQGGAGPVMDALNPSNNPLLREQLKPSSLLLVPLLAAGETDQIEDDEECPVWRDFLDEPRQAIDMEALPSLKELRRHRFNQMEAFDELDVKLGNIEAKGMVGLFRAIRKWLDRGLPGAQGTVYTLLHGSDAQSYACVRITCNWTSDVQALSERAGKPVHRGDLQEGMLEQEDSPADETISVYASTANDPSIDGVALSAQRAGFKLFHRLIKKSSPSYATAVANFHQGVKLIDEYI
jgi:hypothetical protein